MIISRTVGRSALYAASTFYMKGISLFMVPFVVGYLQSVEYGRLELLGSIAIFISVIVAFGLEDALFRFVGLQPDEQSKKTIASEIYGLTVAISVLFTLIGSAAVFIFEAWLPESVSIYLCLILIGTLSLEGIISVPLGWARMKDQFQLYCLLNVSRATIQAVLTFVFLELDRGLTGIFEAGLIAALITGFITFSYQLTSTGISLNKHAIPSLIQYTYPIVMSGLFAFFLNGFDKWVLADQSGLAQLAFYGIAAKFAMVLTIAMQPYGMWWSPARFHLLASTHGKQTLSKYATIGLLQIIVFAFVIGMGAPIAVYILFDAEFLTCIKLIGPLLAVFAIKEAAEFISVGCFSEDTTKKQMHITFMSILIGVVLMIILTPALETIGLIISLVVAQFSRTVALFYYSQKNVYIPIPYVRISIQFIVTFLCVMVSNTLGLQYHIDTDISTFLLNAFMNIAMCTTVFIGLMYLLFQKEIHAFLCERRDVRQSTIKHERVTQ